MKKIFLSLWAAVLVQAASITPVGNGGYTVNFDVAYFGSDVPGNVYYTTISVPLTIGTSTLSSIDVAMASSVRTFASQNGVTVPAGQIFEFTRQGL
jgi:hypothetical protein